MEHAPTIMQNIHRHTERERERKREKERESATHARAKTRTRCRAHPRLPTDCMGFSNFKYGDLRHSCCTTRSHVPASAARIVRQCLILLLLPLLRPYFDGNKRRGNKTYPSEGAMSTKLNAGVSILRQSISKASSVQLRK